MAGFLACSVDEMTYCFLPREEKGRSHGSPGTAGSMALGGAHGASGTHGVCVDSGAPPWNTRLGTMDPGPAWERASSAGHAVPAASLGTSDLAGR